MKWQAIANVTGQIKEEAKNYLVYKLQKDASVELPLLWGDFINETTKHLHDSQSYIEVLPNNKTGGLSTTVKFDELHPDFEDNDKPFSNYALEKYDKRAASFLENVKNPITRKSLQNKIGNYRVDFLNNINHTDIKLVEGKRHTLAIESIEKLKNTTYLHPELYQSHLEDCFNSINSLSLLPQDKEQLLRQAQSELAGAANLGMLKNSPDALINIARLPQEQQPLWMQHLSLEQRIKLDNQVKHLQEHRQIMRQHEVGLAIKSNDESILETGESIKGIHNLVISVYGKDSKKYEQFVQKENFCKQAFSVTDQIKHASFEDGKNLAESLKPTGGDPDFYYKQQIYNIALKSYDEQLRQAQLDPVKFVENIFVDEIPDNMTLSERINWRILRQQQKGIQDPKRLTNFEQAEFISKIKSDDINEVKSTIDSIIGLRNDQGNNYGLEVMEEILKDETGRLPLMIKAYANAKLYNLGTADIFLEMIGKNNLFSKAEEKEFNKLVDDDVKKWSNNLRRQNINNNLETEEVKGVIKYLAAHYSVNLSLSPDKAVKKAVDEMINNRYMEVKGLPIPKEIIEDGRLQHLEKDYIDATLSELKTKIISGDINYGYTQSFGYNAEEARDMIEKRLRLGRWHLTPDKKSVYFNFLTEEGRYLPLLDQAGNVLKFNLIDLNNPDSLTQQKEEYTQMVIEMHNRFGQRL